MKSFSAKESTRTRERLHYLDSLRVLAVLGVFYAHTINIFDILYWNIRGGGQSSGLIVLVIFGTQWGMSLFFFLAGASAWFALASRTTNQFIGERFKRLIIPFIVAFILLSPPQAYLFSVSQGLYHGNFVQFIPYFFEHIHISWNPQWIAAYGYHLWFLAFLFFVSLLTLPVLLLLRRKRGLDFIGWMAALCSKPAGLFVFVVPIALIQIALRAPFPGYQGWAGFFIWLIVYVYGFMLLADTRFKVAIQQQGKFAFLLPYPELGRPKAIGGWGISMGGATMLLAAAQEPAIRGVVADSAYAAFVPLLERNALMPGPIIPGVLFAMQMLYGINFVAVRPVDVVASIAPRPLFFIEGTSDGLVPPWNMNWLAAAANSAPDAHVQTWLVPGANHIQSYDVMVNVYVQRVAAFFTHVLGPARQR